MLKPKGVGVVIEAEHACMTLRGVNTPGVTLTTSHLTGVIRDDARTRQVLQAGAELEGGAASGRPPS